MILSTSYAVNLGQKIVSLLYSILRIVARKSETLSKTTPLSPLATIYRLFPSFPLVACRSPPPLPSRLAATCPKPPLSQLQQLANHPPPRRSPLPSPLQQLVETHPLYIQGPSAPHRTEARGARVPACDRQSRGGENHLSGHRQAEHDGSRRGGREVQPRLQGCREKVRVGVGVRWGGAY